MTDILNILFYTLLFVALYAQVFLLVSFMEMEEKERIQRKKKNAAGVLANNGGIEGVRADDLPTVTVLVPCYNEAETVAPTIESIRALDYPQDKLSILVIDDGSTDATATAVAPYVAAGKAELLHKENGGKHTALNVGIAHTTSDLIAVLDADSFVERDALKKLVARFDDQTIMAVTSFIYIHRPRTLMERIQSAEYVVSGLLRDVLGYLNALFVTPGPFSVYRREVFEKVGGFKPGHLTEDLEMALRMQSHGMRIINVAGARVATVPPSTFRTLLRQRVRWHYGFLNNAYDYRRMFFRAKYGNLGLFSLPAGVISIFAAIILTIDMTKDVVLSIAKSIAQISVTGIQFSMPSFDWFFIRTDPYNLILMSVMVVFIFLILAARRMVVEKRGLFLNTVYFFTLYGIIAPVWYCCALYRVFFSREVRWK